MIGEPIGSLFNSDQIVQFWTAGAPGASQLKENNSLAAGATIPYLYLYRTFRHDCHNVVRCPA
jgi:hypothetical protein